MVLNLINPITGGGRRLALVALLIIGAAPIAAQAVGTTAKVVTVPDLAGKEVTLDAGAAGRPMLVEFWATWCEVCAALMPRMRAAHKAWGSKVDFYGVNVTVNENRNRVGRWVEKEQPPYQVLYDTRGVAVRAFNVPATSYVVMVDATGVIRYTGIGADQDLDAALRKLVQQ